MSELVPQSATHAAHERHHGTYQQSSQTFTGALDNALDAAAPHIIAAARAGIEREARVDALRWAASRARKEHAAKAFRLQTVTDYYPEPGITPTQLDQWADELEAGQG